MSLCLAVFGLGGIDGYTADHPRNPVDVWIKETPWDPAGTNELAAAHGRFYASAGDAGLYISMDGVRWNRDLNVPWDWNYAPTFKEVNGDVFAGFYGGRACWIRAAGTFEWVKHRFDYRALDIEYGNGVYVATDDSATPRVLTSTDGLAWTENSSSTRIGYLAFGNGKFVGLSRGIAVSTDGANWESRNSPVTNSYLSVAFGQGRFVAVGPPGAVVTSTDGDNWSLQSIGATNQFGRVAYGNGRFVVTGGRFVATSTNGLDWVTNNLAPQGTREIVYGNGRFVGGSGFGTSASEDGLNWTFAPFTGIRGVHGVTFWRGRTILGNRDTIWSSTNRHTTNFADWSYKVPSGGNRFAYNDSVIVTAFSHPLQSGLGSTYSRDGTNWTRVNIGATDVIYDGNRFVSVSGSGSARRSIDGINWDSAIATGWTNGLLALAYGNGTYVAGGTAGILSRSSDAQTWQAVDSGVTNHITGLGFGNGVFVATGWDGLILTSTNGADWQRRESHVTHDLSRPAFGHGYWVVVGAGYPTDVRSLPNDSVALFSTNAVDWEVSRTKPEQPLFDVVATSEGFYAVGMGNFRSGHFGPPFLIASGDAPNIELHVQGQIGKSYRAEISETLGSNAWDIMGTFPQTNEVQTIAAPNTGGMRFFRLVEE